MRTRFLPEPLPQFKPFSISLGQSAIDQGHSKTEWPFFCRCILERKTCYTVHIPYARREFFVLSWAWGRNAGRKAGGVLASIAVIFILAALIPLPAFGQEGPQKHLLVLHSYHRGYKWTDDITLGIEAALQGGGKTVSVHYEYMDTKR